MKLVVAIQIEAGKVLSFKKVTSLNSEKGAVKCDL